MVKDSAPSDFFQYSLVGWCSPDLVWWKHEEHQNRFWWRFPHGFRCSLQPPGIEKVEWSGMTLSVELLHWDLRRLLAFSPASDEIVRLERVQSSLPWIVRMSMRLGISDMGIGEIDWPLQWLDVGCWGCDPRVMVVMGDLHMALRMVDVTPTWGSFKGELLVGGLERFLFSPIFWDDDPIWLIFFRGVETTNEIMMNQWISGNTLQIGMVCSEETAFLLSQEVWITIITRKHVCNVRLRETTIV